MIGKLIALVCLSFMWGVHGACAAPQASPSVKQRPAKPELSSAELNKRKEALASRVTELYDLAKAGQWRKMEAFMTEDSKDVFYGQPKNPINEFEVKRIEVELDGKTGKAVVDIKFMAGGFAQLMVLPQPSRWVFENGAWLVKLEKPVAHPLAAFTQGGAAGPPSALRFGQREIEIERGAHEYVVRFQNTGQQTLAVRAGTDPCQCLEVSLDKQKYAPGESGELRIKTEIDADMEPRELRVQVVAEPGPQWTFLTLRLK
jgi:hypothetical protein